MSRDILKRTYPITARDISKKLCHEKNHKSTGTKRN
jgi:hypothetical protein